MAQQTAVEWIAEKMEKLTPPGYQIAISIMLDKAKQMEKQQIVQAYVEGINLVPCDVNSTDELDAEKYYHKTFGK